MASNDHVLSNFKAHKKAKTSHPVYDATSTKSNGVKIDGFLYPNSM